MTSSNDPNASRKDDVSPIKPEILPKGKAEHVDNLLDYCKVNLRDMISYILLIVGILLLFALPIYGGLIIGLVFGIYFSEEVVAYLMYWKESIQDQGVARQLIIAGIVVAFFISSPAIFLGGAIAIAVKQLFIEPKK